MEVGIVDMYRSELGCLNLVNALKRIGVNIVVYHIIDKKVNLVRLIAQSQIKHWVFTGSDQSIYATHSPQIPMNIFNIFGKRFLLICYSMESVLKQLGYPVLKRYERKKELFKLHLQKTKVLLAGREDLFKYISDPAIYKRNHQYYTPVTNMNKQIYEVASYRGELMIVFYKNAVMTQFHPENTIAGKRLIQNWLYEK
jgi:hypothetical protein